MSTPRFGEPCSGNSSPESDELAALRARNAELERQLQDCQLQLQQKLEEQHRSEDRLNNILNSATAAITSLRVFPDGTREYNYISAGCKAVFGYPPEAFVAAPKLWLSRVLPDDREAVVDVETSNSFSDGTKTIEFRFRRADESICWICETITSQWDAAASCWLVTVASLDITERKQLEQTLAHSENQYRLLFESNPHPMWIFDPETLAFLAVNHAAIAKYGYSRPEFLSMTIADIRPVEDIPALKRSVAQIPHSVSTNVYSGKWRHQTRHGALIEVEISGHKMFWEGKSAVFALVKDITEQQAVFRQRNVTQVALHQSEQQIRRILTSISDAFFSVDREWRFTFLNQQAEQLMRQEAQQLLGKSIWEVFPDAVDSIFYDQYHWAIEHQQRVSFEAYYPPYDLWVDVRAYPFEAGLSVYMLNVSKRKRSEAKRKQAESAAQQLQDRLQFVLSNTSTALLTCRSSGDYGATFMSANVKMILGYEAQEFLNDSNFWLDHVHPEDVTIILNGLDPLFNQGHHTHEYRFLHKDGSYRWVQNDLRLIRDGDGNPIEIVGCLTDTTARKQAEQLLQESEEKFRQIADAVQEVFFIYSADFSQILYISPACKQIWGYPPEAFYRKSDIWMQHLYPDDRARIANLLTQVQQQDIEAEYRVVRSNGEVRWFKSCAFRICDAQQQVSRIVGTTRDITSQKQAELALQQLNQELEHRVQQRTEELERSRAALQQREQEVRTLVENSPDIITRFDRSYRCLYINQAVKSVTGLSARAFVGKLLGRFRLLPDYTLLCEVAIYEVFETGAEQIVELEFSISQAIRCFRVRFIPEFNASEQVVTVLGIAEDITEQKQVERTLLKSRDFHLTLLELSPTLIWQTGLDAKSIYYNQSWLSFVGRTLKQELDGGWLKGLHPEDADRCFRTYMEAFELRQPFQMEHRLQHHSGEYHWVIDFGRPFNDLDGNFAGFIGSCYDISDRKQAEVQIQAALREKETLLKEIHHRVKNNLQIISALLSFQTQSVQDPQIRAALQDSEDRLQAMSLIHETLYQSENLGRLNFGNYIRRLADSILIANSSRGQFIKILYQLEPILLNLETAIPCGLLLNELVTNAIKHAFVNRQSGYIYIKLRYTAEPNLTQRSPRLLASLKPNRSVPYYILSIEDDGIGMPDLDLQNPKSLGLRIAFDLAQQLRGRLELDRHNGTRFQLIFSELKYCKRF
ncbi:PAS domain S-box protein [Phormidium tenue FACHB-886]|nr:PAS domain S-box protein [Phormidium tenue FACHB-886]